RARTPTRSFPLVLLDPACEKPHRHRRTLGVAVPTGSPLVRREPQCLMFQAVAFIVPVERVVPAPYRPPTGRFVVAIPVPGPPRHWDSDTALSPNMPNFSLSHKRAKVPRLQG